jgi:hypothetical protein
MQLGCFAGLSEDPQIAAHVIELRVTIGSVEDHETQDYIALLDLCANLMHIDIASSLECCRRALACSTKSHLHPYMDGKLFISGGSGVL